MLFGLLVFGAIVVRRVLVRGHYNRLVAAAEKATRAWNDLDALLRQRHDEIPKLHRNVRAAFAARARICSIGSSKRAQLCSRRVKRAMPTRSGAPNARCERRSDASWPRGRVSRPRGEPGVRSAAATQATLDMELAERRDRYNAAVARLQRRDRSLPGSVVALARGVSAVAAARLRARPAHSAGLHGPPRAPSFASQRRDRKQRDAATPTRRRRRQRRRRARRPSSSTARTRCSR